MTYQALDTFVLPKGFRGRSPLAVQVWQIVQATLFRWSPQFAYPYRRWLLRMFGARIGHGVRVRPTATVTYPWRVRIGENAWVGDHVVLYSLGEIDIGHDAVVSQYSYLCAGSHDHTRADFPITTAKITVQPEAWLAAMVFVASGVTIGAGTVVGVRSSVLADMPSGMICYGSPCRPVRQRLMKET